MAEQTGTSDAVQERLVNCFQQVFPTLDKSAIPAATHQNVEAWDSIAQVTLASLIGEEFGIDIDFEDFEEATSFASTLELVRARTAANGRS